MYKLIKDQYTSQIKAVNKSNENITISIPLDPDNTDYQAYLKWLEEGNTPEAADE